ncbi:MAG: 50S ribosomal protein L29 [Candidatus Peregrinibacteria bacterium]
MPTESSTMELRKMQRADLEHELHELTTEILKLRLGIEMKKEKDTARFKRLRKQRARVMTILAEKPQESLSRHEKIATVGKPASVSKTKADKLSPKIPTTAKKPKSKSSPRKS